jgi:hypothetical protein
MVNKKFQEQNKTIELLTQKNNYINKNNDKLTDKNNEILILKNQNKILKTKIRTINEYTNYNSIFPFVHENINDNSKKRKLEERI